MHVTWAYETLIHYYLDIIQAVVDKVGSRKCTTMIQKAMFANLLS